jgi:hypothetical protein
MNLTQKQSPLDVIANDIAFLYGGSGYYSFKELCIVNTFNPCIILADFYPDYYADLSDNFKGEIFREWQDKTIIEGDNNV